MKSKTVAALHKFQHRYLRKGETAPIVDPILEAAVEEKLILSTSDIDPELMEADEVKGALAMCEEQACRYGNYNGKVQKREYVIYYFSRPAVFPISSLL